MGITYFGPEEPKRDKSKSLLPGWVAVPLILFAVGWGIFSFLHAEFPNGLEDTHCSSASQQVVKKENTPQEHSHLGEVVWGVMIGNMLTGKF